MSLQDIGDKLVSETIPDFACFGNILAGIAFHSSEVGCKFVMYTISSKPYDGVRIYKKL